MQPIIFRQSEVPDPYAEYVSRLRVAPLHQDTGSGIWGVYGYAECQVVLSHPCAHIPALNTGNADGLSEMAWALQENLVRVSNPPRHEIARWVGSHLMKQMADPGVPRILQTLLAGSNEEGKVDWVERVAKRLPVAVLLKTFDFDSSDGELITENIGLLTAILSPQKTPQQVEDINRIASVFVPLVRAHIVGRPSYLDMLENFCREYSLDRETGITYLVSNLIGLFIQSYDAGRGLLSNALLAILSDEKRKAGITNNTSLDPWVMETLRYDPPVQNTRRIAIDDMAIGPYKIKKGETILVVLAAGNRDPRQFREPGQFNPERKNNGDHLTFGFGAHHCVAKYFSVAIATETLARFLSSYERISLSESVKEYEPLVNVRLAKKMILEIGLPIVTK